MAAFLAGNRFLTMGYDTMDTVSQSTIVKMAATGLFSNLGDQESSAAPVSALGKAPGSPVSPSAAPRAGSIGIVACGPASPATLGHALKQATWSTHNVTGSVPTCPLAVSYNQNLPTPTVQLSSGSSHRHLNSVTTLRSPVLIHIGSPEGPCVRA